MAKPANRKLIGGFVLVAVAIMAVSVVIFGSGKFFRKTNEYVLYFEGSVRGLTIGAPVLVRGVQVGSVKSIVIRSYLKDLKSYIPVIIEVNPEKFEVVGDRAHIEDPHEMMAKLIELGLRAQLVTVSLITGQLAIEIDYYPGTPVVLRKLKVDEGYVEIPTTPSTLERLGKALENLNLKEIEARINSILASIDHLLKNPDLETSLHELAGGLQDARHLVDNANTLIKNVDGHAETLSRSMQETLNEAQGTLKSASENIHAVSGDARKLLRTLESQVQPLTAKAQETLDQAKTTLITANEFIGERSETRHKMNHALEAIASAAQSADSLMDYLERHPEALLKGKGGR
jgi:paraquat-inducible protein B